MYSAPPEEMHCTKYINQTLELHERVLHGLALFVKKNEGVTMVSYNLQHQFIVFEKPCDKSL